MKKIAPGHKRQHGANYHTLSEGHVIAIAIPPDASVNPNIGGKRALVFEKSFNTRGGQITHTFRFTCFTDTVTPGETVNCKLKLGNRQIKGNRNMTMYARLDVTNSTPTAELTLTDKQSAFDTAINQTDTETFPFPRESQPGGAILHLL